MKILGTGHALPALLVDAEGLDQRLGLQQGTTSARNRVELRAFTSPGETASSLGALALARALGEAGCAIDDLDVLLFAGVMSEQPMPSTAVTILRHMNPRSIAPITCMDINASCLGFLRGLEIAADGIAAGRWRRAAVVAADLASLGLNWQDLDTATLFGDGAGAAVVGMAAPGDESAVIGSHSLTIPDGYAFSEIRAGGSRFNTRLPPPQPDDYLFRMNGPGLLRMMGKHFPAFLDACLARAGGTVDVVVPHQASAMGLELLRRALGSRATAVIDILRSHGNQVAASLPTALDIAIRSGQLQRGQTVLLIGTAAGVTMGGLVLKY